MFSCLQFDSLIIACHYSFLVLHDLRLSLMVLIGSGLKEYMDDACTGFCFLFGIDDGMSLFFEEFQCCLLFNLKTSVFNLSER